MSKRDDILNATMKLALEEGFVAITLAKIFKEAGVGSGTFYNYFNNKEEVINELLTSIDLLIKQYIINGYNKNDSIYLRFKHIISKYFDFIVEKPEEFLFADTYFMLKTITGNSAKFDAEVEAFNILEDGKKQGILRDISSTLVFEMLYGMISGAARGYYGNLFKIDEGVKHQVTEIMWCAIKI